LTIQVKAETAKKLVLEFISITEEGIDNIKIPDEYLKLTIQGLRNNLEYVSVMAKGVDSFNENEEQQDKIKRTLQYPKAGSCVAAIAGQTKNLADSIQ
jgi:hypothetical protein